MGNQERSNQHKEILEHQAVNNQCFHLSKFERMRLNILQLDDREWYQHKNIRGLIKYAKQLTKELEEFKEKVKMAEKIITDLRATGNDSLDALLSMMN